MISLWLLRLRSTSQSDGGSRIAEGPQNPPVHQPEGSVPTSASTQPVKAQNPETAKQIGSAGQEKPRPESSAPPLESPEAAAAEVEVLKKEATDVVTALINDFPDSPDALRIAGLLYKAYGKKAKAGEVWEKALSLEPTRSDLYVQLATLAQLQGQNEKAADLCRTGLAKAVPTPALYRSMATALNGLGKPDEAVPLLLRAVELSPKDVENHQLLGKTYAMLDQQEKAKASYENVLKLQPGNGTALYLLAAACAKLGLEEQSKQLFDQCRKMAAENRGMVQGLSDVAWHKQLLAVTCGDGAMVYATQRQFGEAEKLLRRAVVLIPTNTTFQARLAAILVNVNRAQEAVPIYQQVIALEPKNPVHYMAFAEIYARLGRFNDASVVAKKAVDLQPDNAEYRRILTELEARR